MIERLGFLFAGIRKCKELTYDDITKEIPTLSPQVLEMWENGDNTRIKLHEVFCLMDLFDIGLEITMNQKNNSVESESREEIFYKKDISPRISSTINLTMIEFFINYEEKNIPKLIIYVRDNTPYLMTAKPHGDGRDNIHKVIITKKP